MSCEYPVLCPECDGKGFEMIVGHRVECPTCHGDGEVCPAKRDAYRTEHGPDC